MSGDELKTWFNLIEAGWWVIFGVFMLVSSRGWPPSYRGIGMVAGMCSFFFALSDVIESRTGAWWRPVELLAFKSICVMVYLGCIARWAWLYRAARRASDAIIGEDA
jgi:hypothetical protein